MCWRGRERGFLQLQIPSLQVPNSASRACMSISLAVHLLHLKPWATRTGLQWNEYEPNQNQARWTLSERHSDELKIFQAFTFLVPDSCFFFFNLITRTNKKTRIYFWPRYPLWKKIWKKFYFYFISCSNRWRPFLSPPPPSTCSISLPASSLSLSLTLV